MTQSLPKSPDGPVRVDRAGPVLRLTVARPQRHNPLSLEVLRAIRDALLAARDDPTLACVALRGAGDRYFAAGGDLNELDAVRTAEAARGWSDESRAVLDVVRDFPLPVVALLNGDAIGGGAELAVACDFRVMREGAHVGYIHGRLGITAAWGGGADLVALVGPSRALRMMVRHELVPAGVALQWGLADAVVPADRLELGFDEFIAPMLSVPSATLRAMKAITRAARAGGSHEALRELESRSLVDSWMRPEHWAAVERVRGRPRG
jgi:enoyl-CoA hydratase/carnithine racemase